MAGILIRNIFRNFFSQTILKLIHELFLNSQLCDFFFIIKNAIILD